MWDGQDTEAEALRVLLVDDSADDAELVARELQRSGRRIVVDRDWTMPTFSGGAALDVLKAAGLDIPFIIVSGTVTEELAVAAMRAGASDWVLKGKMARLLPAVDRDLRERAERKHAVAALRLSEIASATVAEAGSHRWVGSRRRP